MMGFQRISILFIILGTSAAWTTPNASPAAGISRRSLLDGVVASAIGGAAIVAIPGTAQADVTSKISSSAALRNVKRSEKQLKNLLPLVESNDFLEVKGFFRTPPFADIRKNASILVRGGEDGPKAEELQKKYSAMIASIEKLDGTSSLGIRGRNIPQLQMSKEYIVVESSLGAFLKIAEEAAATPVQYADED